MPKKRKSKRTPAAAAAKPENDDDNDDSYSNDDDADTDDAAMLWEKLQTTQRKKMKQLVEESAKLQKEKTTMLQNSVASTTTDDIITINAGGKLITALRSTLTIPDDSMWSYMFSGRWEECLTRDNNGNIFLDYNHELIEIIVDYLRMKKVEDPSNPLTYPYVPSHKFNDFRRLLQYFGLVEFFETKFVFSTKNFVQYGGGSKVKLTGDESNNTIDFLYDTNKRNYYGIACTTDLDPSGDGSFWKVQIDKCTDSSIFIGIIGKLKFSQDSYDNSTCYGWMADDGYIYVDGNCDVDEEDGSEDGWEMLGEGDCLYFRFKSNKLTVHNVRKNKTFVIDNIDSFNTTKFHIHICFYSPQTAVTLGPLESKERLIFSD